MDDSIGFQMVSEQESSPGTQSDSTSPSMPSPLGVEAKPLVRHSLQERANAQQALRGLQRELAELVAKEQWQQSDIPKYWYLKDKIVFMKDEYIYQVVKNHDEEISSNL